MDTLAKLAETVDGRLQGADRAYQGVGTDTRSLAAGELFVALRGERFDGHEFLRRAAALGAAGALVEEPAGIDLPQVVVKDTLAAMQRAAAARRVRYGLPVVAITGSNGKTTVKEMLAAILADVSGVDRVLATRGNLNNHIGVPLTLLRLTDGHSHAVVEMGANHPGEISLLVRLARPNVAVITNAGTAHLEGFGSREGVARAKGELFADLAADGVAVINADDQYANLWGELAGDRRKLHFGLTDRADISADGIESGAAGARFTLTTPAGTARVQLPLHGRHNVANALAAAAAAYALGVPVTAIARGLAAVQPVAGRLQLREAAGGARVIDDSYNANPNSLGAALDLLAAQPGERWLILGDMAELGDQAEAAHAEAGEAALRAGVDRLFTVGRLSRAASEAFGGDAEHFEEQAALIAALRGRLRAGMTLLVKGSRSAGMERVVAALVDDGGAREAAGC